MAKRVDLTALGEARPELLPHPGLETLLTPRADAEAIGLRCQLQQLLAAVQAGRSRQEVACLSAQVWMPPIASLPPGSPEARQHGCTCPRADNEDRAGTGQRVYAGGCPVHAEVIARLRSRLTTD